MNQSLAPIISSTEAAPGVYLVWLESTEIAQAARPGQFVMVRCGAETLLRRPLSIHQVDGEKIALLFAAVGKGTQWLSKRKAGEKIDLFGPLGNGFSIHPDSKNLLLVAGGMGVAPLAFLAQEAARLGHSVKMLLGAATSGQLCPGGLPADTELSTATEDGSAGRQCLVTDLLPDYAAWADQVFACGPMPMYKAMAQMTELKQKPVQVSLEMMMGCGFGVCYGCTVKTTRGLRQVCKDGPVFDLEDMLA